LARNCTPAYHPVFTSTTLTAAIQTAVAARPKLEEFRYMGIFMMSEASINKVVTALADNRLAVEILANETGFNLTTLIGQRALAEAIFRLNADAIVQRYGCEKAARLVPLDFVYQPQRVALIEAFELLCRWLSQCREGDVARGSMLYRALESTAGRLAIEMISCWTLEEWPSTFSRHIPRIRVSKT
jgi:hypothetical protein